MEILRKIMLAAAVISFCVCGLFLNLMGGIGLCMNNYAACGYSLIISTGLFAVSLVTAFFRKSLFNIISVITNIVATLLWIYPIAVLTGIPNEVVPKTSVEILINRIYPAVIITLSLGLATAADMLSADRMAARAAKKAEKTARKNRALAENEKII